MPTPQCNQRRDEDFLREELERFEREERDSDFPEREELELRERLLDDDFLRDEFDPRELLFDRDERERVPVDFVCLRVARRGDFVVRR